jgi:DmsE family decaheme c-type cytochrome
MSWKLPLAALAVALLAAGGALAQGAGPVCADCHDEVAAGMSHQIHMRIQPFEVQGRAVGCEGCHGDGTRHMEEGDASLIRTFTSAEDYQACVSCHSSKGLAEWSASTHAMEEVGCDDCHSIHSASNPLDGCKGCHAAVYAELQLPSHHPVREGKMTCVSCHDPHAATEAQLKSDHMRLNDTCFGCHQDKEGPFIFEHPPVVEDCRLCHTPHGSVANNLLTANEPMLCYQCHEPHFHAALVSPEGPVDVGGTEYENPHGATGMNIAFTTACSQCHHAVHGSDLPSQSLASGGRGLVR